MDREEAIVRIERIVDSTRVPKDKMALLMALDDMHEQEELRWVSTKERFPEKDGRYLCVWQRQQIIVGIFLNGHFRLYGEVKDNLISHWMPMPAFPEV